jgi:hypothetical protein
MFNDMLQRHAVMTGFASALHSCPFDRAPLPCYGPPHPHPDSGFNPNQSDYSTVSFLRIAVAHSASPRLAPSAIATRAVWYARQCGICPTVQAPRAPPFSHFCVYHSSLSPHAGNPAVPGRVLPGISATCPVHTSCSCQQHHVWPHAADTHFGLRQSCSVALLTLSLSLNY